MAHMHDPHDILHLLRTQDADLYLVTLMSPAPVRAALATLFVWDATLATAAFASPEAMVNLIRLAWWREQVEALDVAQSPASAPLLDDIRNHILPLGITGAQLAALEAPWADMLEDDEAFDVARWCCQRGGALFDLATQILAPDSPEDVRQSLHQRGHIWAMAQWARTQGLDDISLPFLPPAKTLPAALKPLAALARVSLRDLHRLPKAPPRKGGPLRLVELLFGSLRNR